MRISVITYANRKTNIVRNIAMLISIAILSVLILIMLISSYVGWKLVHPKRLSIPTFSSNIVPEYKDAVFTDKNKTVALKGWYFESKGSDKTIILAHGYGQNRLEFKEKTLDMIKSFLAKGYNFLAFDFRGCGVSEGKLTSLGLYEKDDILGAIKYAKLQGSKHIILLGYSMGASASILAAAESSDVDAVISDSAFSDLKEYVSKELSVWSGLPSIPFNKTIMLSLKVLTGIDPSNVSPKKVISSIKSKPILFIHSKDDKQVPFSAALELYGIYSKVAGSKAELWETSNADHVKSYTAYTQEYMNRVLDFLDRVYRK